MKKKYQMPEYEIILLSGANVITESGNQKPWDTGDVPATAPRPNSVWSDEV